MSKAGFTGLSIGRLHRALSGFSQPYPIVDGNRIWLLGDTVECAGAGDEYSIKRHIRIDTELREVVAEAFCPNWRILNLDDALRFANRWNFEHRHGLLIVDMWRARFVWRWVIDVSWIESEKDLGYFVENQYIEMERESSECFESAYCELHNIRFSHNEDPVGFDGECEGWAAKEAKSAPPERGRFPQRIDPGK